jgi:hypothetical protein
MRWARHVEHMGRRIVYRVLVLKPEGKTTLGKARRRWEDNIKIVLQEVRKSNKLFSLDQDRDRWQALVNAEMKLRFL